MRFLLICALMFVNIGALIAADGAKITFKSKNHNFYLKTEDRSGKSFTIRSYITKEITYTLPDEVCNVSMLWVQVDGAYSWLKVAPGDDIIVGEKEQKIVSEGAKQQQINDYLSDWTKMAYSDISSYMLQNIDGMVNFKRKNPTKEQVLTQENLQKMETLCQRALKQLKDVDLSDKKFVEEQKIRIKLQSNELYCQVIMMHKDAVETLPKKIFDFLPNVDLNHEYAATYPGLENITNIYFELLDTQKLISYNVANHMSVRASKLKNEAVIERYILNEFRTISRLGCIYRIDEIIADATPCIKSQAGIKEFANYCEQLKTICEKENKLVGTASEDFAFEDRNGKIVKLSDFKGKYVFVDVWATWCGPCTYAIPFLMKMEKEFHGEDIQFISLSVDKKTDHEKWKKYLIDHNMDGVCLITPDDFNHSFIERFGIKSIPQFLLFNKNGEVISVGNRRPYDPIMKLQLKELIDN